MDITQWYYKPYTKEDNPTDEQIRDYVNNFATQFVLIDDIKKVDKNNEYNPEDLIKKSNEELQTIRKTILANNI